LILDDWALSPLEGQVQHDLLEIIDDRAGARSTIVTSQLPMAKWHDVIADPSVADALLDRLVRTAVKIEMKGDSLRGK
jgi:DNA replication protein DnaC